MTNEILIQPFGYIFLHTQKNWAKQFPTFNQHWATYILSTQLLVKSAQLMFDNQFAMWMGKLNCPSVGDPSDFTQLYNCLTVGYIFSWVITCQIDGQNLIK